MKKTVILGLVIILLGASVGYATFASAKQGTDDKNENSKKSLQISDDNFNRSVSPMSLLNKSSVSPQDLKFTVSVKQDGSVKIQGKVVASPTSVATANRIYVQSWFGTFAVDTTNAKVIHRYGGQGTITDIKVGDMVVFDGVANQNDTTIVAKLIRDMSVWTKSVDYSGTISNIDIANRTFILTINSSANEDRKPATIKVTADTKVEIVFGNAEVSFTALTNGMRARVWGLYNVNTQTIAANRINAKNIVNPNSITVSATSTAQ